MRRQRPTCREVVELVSDYLDGSLPRRDRRRFESHVSGCDACTAYLRQMRETVRLSGRLREDDVPEPVRRELVAEFRDWRSSSS